MIHEPRKLTEALDVLLSEVKKNRLGDVSVSLLEFIEEVKYMMDLYGASSYTRAEQTRDKLAKQLDDIMRLGNER
jgi:hypothetical protein